VAQKSLDESHISQMLRRSCTKIFWAGESVNNLVESIEDVARRNELRRIRYIDSSMEEYVLTLLGDGNAR
jgi:hypothetical protein